MFRSLSTISRRCFSSLREIDTTLLGFPVRDTTTQYSGMVTGVSLYVNGCTQNCVEALTGTELVGWFIDSAQLVPLEEVKTKRSVSYQHPLGSEAEDITGLKGKLIRVTVGMSREVQYELQPPAVKNKMGPSYALSENRIKVLTVPTVVEQRDDQPAKSPGGPMRRVRL